MLRTKIPRIVVIGSLNVDLTTFVDLMPAPGETIFGREFHLGFGGKGGNQAAAARLCGADVSMVARVGEDLFGAATLDDLSALGVDTTHVTATPATSTGVAPIFIDTSGQNRILVVKGANDRLSPHDVDRATELIRNADVLILQFEIPLGTVHHALEIARASRTLSIVNPAPAQAVDLHRLSLADYIIPNETEAAAMTGRVIRTLDDARDCAKLLTRAGFSRVVITLGASGAFYASEAEVYHVPSFPVEPVDTSGAGDAFIGSLAVCLASGLSDREALSRANLYAALSTLRTGTRRAFPRRDQWLSEWSERTKSPSAL